MKVLLTGASGFVGRYVLEQLLREGIETVVVGRRPPLVSTQFIQQDFLELADFSAVVEQARATHLLHLAWYTEHGKFWASSLNYRWVDATVRLVEAFCEAGGQHVVVAGSGTEYDWSCGYMQEDVTALRPGTVYGVAKDATRRLTKAVCGQHEVRHVWGRVFFPYGEGESSLRLIPSLIDVFLGRRPAFGVNAAAYRDFMHVNDVAEGFMALLRSEAAGVFNICSGQPALIADLVMHIAARCDADAQQVLALATARPGDPAMVVGDNSRLVGLGWKQKASLEQGLANYIEQVQQR